jgi:hypothetical protein
MSEILSWEEMSQRFYGEWLLIVDAELDDCMGVLGGEVLAHSPNQGEIYDVLHLRRGRSASIEYVGECEYPVARLTWAVK